MWVENKRTGVEKLDIEITRDQLSGYSNITLKSGKSEVRRSVHRSVENHREAVAWEITKDICMLLSDTDKFHEQFCTKRIKD